MAGLAPAVGLLVVPGAATLFSVSAFLMPLWRCRMDDQLRLTTEQRRCVHVEIVVQFEFQSGNWIPKLRRRAFSSDRDLARAVSSEVSKASPYNRDVDIEIPGRMPALRLASILQELEKQAITSVRLVGEFCN